ncbi:MAG: phospholipid carrier-dependent glycosyltransferase [Candidatus Binatia bacterium]
MNHTAVPLSHEGGALGAVTHRPALRIPRWGVWAFSLAIVLTYSCLLGGYGLGEPDEPRYAEIAREMIELRDWVTPHLNYVKYFEKPPFVYWLTAVNFEVFGTSEFVARLWPALFGLMGIVMTHRLGRSMYDPWTGYAAAAVLAASPLYFGLSQVLILDMPLTALMTLALSAFWLAYSTARHRWALVPLLYVATAFAVLTKGPVAAVLNGGIIIAFLVLRGELSALRWLLSPLAIVLFFVITLPWFVLVSRRNPEFLDFFIVDQHLRRFLSPDEHQQGPWFFIPIVWGGMLPWSAFVLFAPSLLRRFGTRLLQRRVSAATLFCVLWSGVVFTFFSLSGSKLATYVLPMFCPLAILAARIFQRVLAEGHAQVLVRGCVALIILAIVAALGGVVAGAVVDLPEVGLIVPRTYVGACVIAGFAAAALIAVRRHAYQAGFVMLLLGMLVLQLVAISGREVVPQYRSLGRAIRNQLRPQDQVILYNHYVQGIPFYSGRRAVVVGGHGELDFGSRQGDQSAFFWKSDQALLEAWQSPGRVFLVINRMELDPLQPRLHPAPRQIAAEGKKVLIVNFAG